MTNVWYDKEFNRTLLRTVDTYDFPTGYSTLYLDEHKKGTFTVSKDEKLLRTFNGPDRAVNLRQAKEYFNQFKL